MVAEPFAMLGRANASREWLCGGAALSHFYKLPRERRSPPGRGEQGATRETWAAQNAHGREWLSGMNNFSRGGRQ